MTSCPIISIVSELRHAHCCMSSYQSNSRSCVGTTRVGVKVQMTQFIGSLLSLSLLLYELWYQMKSPIVSWFIYSVYCNVTLYHIPTEQRNWDFNIAADLQELSKIRIYVDMYVIEDILKTSTQNGNEVVMHSTHIMYGRKEGSF